MISSPQEIRNLMDQPKKLEYKTMVLDSLFHGNKSECELRVREPLTLVEDGKNHATESQI